MTHVQKTHTSKGVRCVSGDICRQTSVGHTHSHTHSHTHTHTLLGLLCSLCTRPVLYSRRYQDIHLPCLPPLLLPGKASGYLSLNLMPLTPLCLCLCVSLSLSLSVSHASSPIRPAPPSLWLSASRSVSMRGSGARCVSPAASRRPPSPVASSQR